MNHATNRLITFEGVDGCGKSTQLRRAADWIADQGFEVVSTFEPGDTPLGAEIRRLLLDGEFTPVAEAELLLFLADRAQHVQTRILPALKRGAWVLCDRYSDSTLAYQLAARCLEKSAQDLRKLLAFAECGVRPAVTLWFDVSISEAMKRMRRRAEAGEKSTRLDDEAASFHQRVADAFARQYYGQQGRIVQIDAGRNMDKVEQQVKTALTGCFRGLKA
jgi:dTMP kinase